MWERVGTVVDSLGVSHAIVRVALSKQGSCEERIDLCIRIMRFTGTLGLGKLHWKEPRNVPAESTSDAQQQSRAAVLEDAFTLAQQDPQILKFYTNGFGIALSNADVGILLQLSGKPIGIMYLSYTLAKTLHERLGQVVRDFETQSNQKLLTTDQVDTIFAQRKQ